MDLTPLGPQRKQPAWSHRYQNSSQVWSDPCCKRPSCTPQSGTEDKKKKQVKKVNLFFLTEEKNPALGVAAHPQQLQAKGHSPILLTFITTSRRACSTCKPPSLPKKAEYKTRLQKHHIGATKQKGAQRWLCASPEAGSASGTVATLRWL